MTFLLQPQYVKSAAVFVFAPQMELFVAPAETVGRVAALPNDSVMMSSVVMRAVPVMSKLYDGLLVPIPTLALSVKYKLGFWVTPSD